MKYRIFDTILGVALLLNAMLIQATPTINSQPTNMVTCTSLYGYFCVTATAGSGSLTYQWQASSNGTSGWASVVTGTPAGLTYVNGTAACVQLNASSAIAVYYFRCVVTDGSGSVNTNTVTATINTYSTYCGTGIKEYGFSNASGYPEEGYSLVEATDAGLVVAGMSNGVDPAGGGDAVLFKINTTNNGSLSWGRHLGSSSSGNADYFYCVTKNTAGNYLVAGRVENSGGSNWDPYVALFPYSGASGPTWTFKYSSSNDRRLRSAIQSSAGDYIFTGYSVESTYDQLYALRVSSAGALTWSKQIGYGTTSSSNVGEEGFSLVENSDGTIMLLGGTTYSTDDEIALVKLTSTGGLTWTHTLGKSTTNETGKSIKITSTGHYIITGYTTSGAGGKDIYVAKLNSDGTTNWEKTIGSSTYDEYGYSIIECSDGTYVIAGYSEKIASPFDDDALIVKIKNDGSALVWTRKIDSGADNAAWQIIEMSDGTFATAGQKKWDPDSDIEIITLDASGNITTACTNTAPTLTLNNPSFTNQNRSTNNSATASGTAGTETTENASISTFTLSGSCGIIVLPVELSDFKLSCADHDRTLTWTTEVEQNNHYFTIEHSVDGVTWSDLLEVNGAGTSYVRKHYRETFTEEGDYRYYRLRQTDMNGNTSHTSIITASCVSHENWLGAVFPNPASSALYFTVLPPASGVLHLQLMDISGRVVADKAYEVENEVQELNLSIGDLDNGLYLLKAFLEGTDYTQTTRIIKN